MITQPEIRIEFRYNGDNYTAHVSITMEAISGDQDAIKEEVMDTLRQTLRGPRYDVTMTVIDETGVKRED
jgi:hypothetical protein